MGQSQSDQKAVDTTGTVNNNVVLEGPIEVEHSEVVILLTIITIILIVRFVLEICLTFRHSIKSKYIKKQGQQQQQV